jgi:alkyl hydroperoxide reductase subunit AhpC
MEDEHGGTGQETSAAVGGRRRTVQVKFRVTKDERALIAEKMRLLHTDNLAAYLRKMAIDGYIINTDTTDIKAMTAEIQKIGVNVNQIAKKINTYGSGSVYVEDMEKIQEVLAEIWRLQRSILSKAR